MNFTQFIDYVREITKSTADYREINSKLYSLTVSDDSATEIVSNMERVSSLVGVIRGLRAGYQQYLTSMTYGARLAFPASELVLIEREGKKNKRIRERWDEFGGQTYRKRKVAVKLDPIWSCISFFGFPFPPFDVSCGYGIDNVSFDEAERLGVVESTWKEIEDIDLAPNPEYSFCNYDYMQAVCRRIIDVIR